MSLGHRARGAWVPCVSAALVLSACASEPQPLAVAPETASPRMVSEPMGTVELAATPTGSSIHLAMVGLQPGSSHPVFGLEGTCTEPGAVELGVVQADSMGRVSADVGLPAVLPHVGAVSRGLSVIAVTATVGPGVAGMERDNLACAEVVNPPAGPARIAAMPPFDQVKTTVALKYDRVARVLTVTVHATGLAPGSHHPSHIHTGQCESEGPVRETLKALDADAQGTADATTTVPQSDGIKFGAWYIAVHAGPGLGSQSQFALLACGDVVR